MHRLTEDAAKAWLRACGLDVPAGATARSPDEARHAAETIAGSCFVKALVPSGRRGKAGAVIAVATPDEAAAAAARLIGGSVEGFAVDAVYVEAGIAIREELYLSFILEGDRPEMLISTAGGVEIESASPERLVRASIDPLAGLDVWTATDLWLDAGLRGAALAKVAAFTARLYDAFCRADALLLEVNPLALDDAGRPHIVGAMLGVDADALHRHPQWAGAEALPENPRERAVAIANRSFAGGECRYVELDGDIGLLVGGGGAGLYQHDLVIGAGGRPANHCVTPPTGADNRKLRAVLEAILDNPKLRGLLVGFNFAQMARTDIRVRTLVDLLDERRIDRLPIVIRLFGAGEADSRAMVAGREHIHYVPRGTTLEEAVGLIVRLTS